MKDNSVQMPNPSKNNVQQLNHSGQIVIVGANGSGKSRLGAWLENPESLSNIRRNNYIQAFRIGSHRDISLPQTANRVPYERATDSLRRGIDGPGGQISRIGGDSAVGASHDFVLLMNALFADRTEADRKYREMGFKTDGIPGLPPACAIENLKIIWEKIFSGRHLVIGDHLLEARSVDDIAYSASSLSDGERVGFYLMAHILLAPENSRLVIDEPELYLHESIQSMIWDELESARKDCVFIYITHSLAFAAGRGNATKVVLYDYISSNGDGPGEWVWDLVPTYEEIPQNVVMSILGSRREALFVEGIPGSLDQRIYMAIFPDWYVVPSVDCGSVERCVAAFRKQFRLHHLEVRGIIDRDDRNDDEVRDLEGKKIYPLPVGAVENMLALPECLERYAAMHLSDRGDPAAAIREAKRRVFNAMQRDRNTAILKRSQHCVRRALSHSFGKNKTKEEFVQGVNNIVSSIDPARVYDEVAQATDNVFALVVDDAYPEILRLFRNKAILPEIAAAFSVTTEQYISRIIELLSSDHEFRKKIRIQIKI